MDASSPWGPVLCGLGLVGLVVALWVHCFAGKPTLFHPRASSTSEALSFWERLSVHLIVYDLWALAFGAVLWRGPAKNYLDTHLAFERSWAVYPAWEWLYVTVYFVPFLMPWLAPHRAALRRYVWQFSWISVISLTLYFALPFGSPPRPFVPDSVAGHLLQWETQRPDFAAAALPSFHVFWALVCAGLLSARSPAWVVAGALWAVAATISCVANGAHAVLDVVASVVIYFVVAYQGRGSAWIAEAERESGHSRSRHPRPSCDLSC